MQQDPSHRQPKPSEDEIALCAADKEILKRLGASLFDAAQDPVNNERRRLWQKLNDMQAERPMVWINELPWHEMNVDDELTLGCTHPWAIQLEKRMRQTLYQWRHLPGDMVINPWLDCPLVINSTHFGIDEDVDILRTNEDSDVVSRHFKRQIDDYEDLEKIRMPIVTHDKNATDNTFSAMREIFKGIIEVRKTGQKNIWYTPWDNLIRWWGVEQAMMDLVERPDLVHAAYERMVQACLVELDQFEAQNLLSLDNGNTRVGSGGYGYTDALPGSKYDPGWVRSCNMWGCSNAQILAAVSPEMHWEFAVEHDLKWLSRFGLTYYGCCEPLHQKIDMLKRIPNLRKISVSPWCDSERIIRDAGPAYVLSRKPNPAVFVGDGLDVENAKKDLTDFLSLADHQCHIEFIMKDISTVGFQPQKLWQWERLAMETVLSW